MRKVISTLFMSLDGVVEAPDKWSFPYWNDEIAKFKQAEQLASGALLLGRVTYEVFAAAWPSRTDPQGFADSMNNSPKHVVSNTLRDLKWNNSMLVQGDVADAVRKLKQESGRDILIHGSPTLVRFLMAHGLVDQYRFLVYPIVLGSGKRFFEPGGQVKLQLAESRPLGEVVALIYQPTAP